MNSTNLRLPPDRMREAGYRTIDLLIEHITAVNEKPAMRVSPREALESRLREPLPRSAAEFETVAAQAISDVFSSMGHLTHPRFFGFIPTPSNWISVLADLLAAGMTPFCGTWLEGSGPTQVELVTIDWLKELLGLPASAGGLFVSGGSIANLTALATARDSKPNTTVGSHVIYCSDQTHSSIDRALKIVGYAEDQVRRLPSDIGFRLSIDELRRSITEDRRHDRQPHIVVANAGTTNTGAVDPLRELASLCDGEDIWLHVDGAYGASAVFSDAGAKLLDGISLADSVTLDPHKWLFQPYPLGCLLVRDVSRLSAFYHVMPEYLQDTEPERGEVNLCDYGPELTRPFRALKLWMSLKVFGADAFARAIDHGIALAEFAERTLREDTCWEIVSPAQLGIICFRFITPGLAESELDELNTNIARDTAEDGCCFLSTTKLRGRPVLRMCTINPETTENDLRISIDCLRRAGFARVS